MSVLPGLQGYSIAVVVPLARLGRDSAGRRTKQMTAYSSEMGRFNDAGGLPVTTATLPPSPNLDPNLKSCLTNCSS